MGMYTFFVKIVKYTEVHIMSKMIQLIFLTVAAAALSGCFPVTTRIEAAQPGNVQAVPTILQTERVAEMITQTPTPWQTATAPPTATAIAEHATPTAILITGMGIETVTFTDEYAGFAFDYPADWVITALDPSIAQTSSLYTHSLRSPMPTRGPKQQEGIPPGATGIDVVVINEEGKTLEEAVAERKQSYREDEFQPTVVSEDPWTLPSGLKAVRFLLDTRNGRVANMVTVVNGRVVMFSGMGELALFEPIAQSLRSVK